MKKALHYNQSGRTPVWLAIVIVLVVGFLAWLIWLMISPEQVGIEREVTIPQSDGAPATLFTLVGVVESIGVRRFTMRALADRNYFVRDYQVTVDVSAETEYMLTTPADPSSGMLIERRDGGFEDLEVGDNVTITSDEDILNKTEFLASKVEKVR